MTTQINTMQSAVSQVLDALEREHSLTMFYPPNGPDIEPFLTALHEEARRRGMGVVIEPAEEGGRLCLSLRHP